MTFEAEIIRTSQRKLVSSDNQYELLLRTDNPMILDLGKLPSDTIVVVMVELKEDNGKTQTKRYD
jgi:hypothetical protein